LYLSVNLKRDLYIHVCVCVYEFKGYRPERVMGEIQVCTIRKKHFNSNLPSETAEVTAEPTGVVPLGQQRRHETRDTHMIV